MSHAFLRLLLLVLQPAFPNLSTDGSPEWDRNGITDNLVHRFEVVRLKLEPVREALGPHGFADGKDATLLQVNVTKCCCK